MYKVMCTIGDSDDVFAETLQTEFSGIEHETREEAEKELDEAWEHPAVNYAWIVEDEEEPEDDTDDFENNNFADWLMNPERKNESAAVMLAKHFVKDDGKQSVVEMRELLDFAENALRERIAKIAYKKGLMEIELEEKLTEQGLDAENIEAICAIYDRMLADQMEKEVI